MTSPKKRKRLKPIHVIGLAVATTALALGSASLSFGDSSQLTGAVFTTDSTCNVVNQNLFVNKQSVYLDGGPQNENAGSGLPEGDYYVKVEAPSGALLGTSVPTAPVHVDATGSFVQCYQLWAILTQPDLSPGYADTDNPGGEYKVFVSDDPTFDKSKTDNFKVLDVYVPPPPQATLQVTKFYDANANGTKDPSESDLTGWQINLTGDAGNPYFTPHDFVVTPGTYTVGEGTPTQTNWFHTTAASVTRTVADGDVSDIKFGNVCTGAGGGLTLGFWSNKNGQALFGDDDKALMVSLNLRNANGTAFDPANYAAFRTWLLNASATNMAYMLSAQLAAMELNVYNGKVAGSSLVYAPGVTGANPAGFISVSDLMTQADTKLGLNGNTVAASSDRTYQEILKNALDKANNNLNFAQSSPCPFSFAIPV